MTCNLCGAPLGTQVAFDAGMCEACSPEPLVGPTAREPILINGVTVRPARRVYPDGREILGWRVRTRSGYAWGETPEAARAAVMR